MHWQTHTVFNQPAPLSNSNLFLSDCALRDAVVREGAEWDMDSWVRQSRWSWAGWRTLTRRNCCVMTPRESGWMTSGFIRHGIF